MSNEPTTPPPEAAPFRFTIERTDAGGEYYVQVQLGNGLVYQWVPANQVLEGVSAPVRRLLAEQELNKLFRYTQWLGLSYDFGGGRQKPVEPLPPTQPGGPSDGETRDAPALDDDFWTRLSAHLDKSTSSAEGR